MSVVKILLQCLLSLPMISFVFPTRLTVQRQELESRPEISVEEEGLQDFCGSCRHPHFPGLVCVLWKVLMEFMAPFFPLRTLLGSH